MFMKNFIEAIENRVLVYDGSKGYLLQKMGLKGGECPELWNVENQEKIREVYISYKEAGCDVIQTNTFQGNRIQLDKYSLAEMTYQLNFEGAKLAREVMGSNGFVAASIGPIGKLFEPSGDLTFDKAYEVYKEQVAALVDGGVDVINFETFTDLAEMRAAYIAAREVTNLPVICSFAFESNGRTLMGTDPFIAALVMKSLGAEMVGANCSFGPEHMVDIIKKMHEVGGVFLCVKPNAGMPEMIDGEVIYNETPENFSRFTKEFIEYNARLIGGCCGTTPEFIKAVKEKAVGLETPEISEYKGESIISSAVKNFNTEGLDSCSIGEINTEKDKELLSELIKGNLDYVVDKAMDLAAEGHDIVYVNTDNVKGGSSLLGKVVNSAQGYIKHPFIIETRNPEALEYALKLYNGRAGVVIKDLPDTNIDVLISTAKKYGSKVLRQWPTGD